MQATVSNGQADVDILRTLEECPDIATWINDALDDGDESVGVLDLAGLEKRVSQLSAVVEIAYEDTSMQLEKNIDDISRTVPRLTYDLQLMQENALSLQHALHQVERHSESFLHAEEMSVVLEQLHSLDLVKRNMDAALVVLKEAEAWSSLESEVVSYLSEQSYQKAAARLSEASKSLGVFENTSEFEARKTLMTNLQNQLEAALSSALIAVINNNDVDACRKYFEIFCNIEREAEFRSYWNGSKRKGVAQVWQSVVLKDCSEGPDIAGERKLTAFLPEFFGELLSVLQVERLSAALIFPDPQPTLSTFIASTLTSLHPLPLQRLNTLITFYGDEALPEIIAAFRATEDFAVATDKIMEKIGATLMPTNTLPSADDRDGSQAPHRAHGRRQSIRQSFSRRLSRPSGSVLTMGNAGGTTPLDHAWEETLFEPFLDYQCDYGTLERRILRHRLRQLSNSSRGAINGARLLRERSVDVLTHAEEALGRCMSFTHGYGVVGLIQALDDLFEAFLESTRRDILDSNPTSLPASDSFEAGEDFAELDYSASDLSLFQLTLHLLDAARGVLDRLSSFEGKLRSSILQVSQELRAVRDDPGGVYVSRTTRTALSMLQTSVLNNIELQSLFDVIDPELPLQPHSAFTPATASFGSHRKQVGQSNVALLTGARNSVSDFAQACQARLQETILGPLLKNLSTYASQPIWSSSDPRERRTGTPGVGGGAGAINDASIPTFSLSPTATIQRVAEGLLSLPRLFEVYADDDALAFSIETLPFVNVESLQQSTALSPDPTSTTSVSLNQPHGEEEHGSDYRPQSRHLTSSSTSLSITVPPVHSHATSQTLALTPEAVSSAWLASLSLALLSHFISQILPSLTRLSAHGAAQLAEDLAYLGQIGRALGVEWAPLEAWREAAGMEMEVLRRRVHAIGNPSAGVGQKSSEDDGTTSEKPEMIDAMRAVARLRGWNV